MLIKPVFYVFIMQNSLVQFSFLTNKKSPKECCCVYTSTKYLNTQVKYKKKSIIQANYKQPRHKVREHSTKLLPQ